MRSYTAPLSYLASEGGLTLVELLVALGLTGLMLVLVVTGSLFVQKFITDWSARDKVIEELTFLSREFASVIERSMAVARHADTVLCLTATHDTARYWIDAGILIRDGLPLSRTGLTVETISVHSQDLPLPSETDTLGKEALPRGLYRMRLVVTDTRGNRDSLVTVVRNDYEYFKYSQEQIIP